jgi:hypothetical protein
LTAVLSVVGGKFANGLMVVVFRQFCMVEFLSIERWSAFWGGFEVDGPVFISA